MSIHEVARELNAGLGPTLVAALTGSKDRKLPIRWAHADGPEPGTAFRRRLLLAHRVWTLIAPGETAEVARAWFIGANPFLDEDTPLTAIRGGPGEVGGRGGDRVCGGFLVRMRFYRSGARVGSRTGLVLVPAGGEREFRVASSAYGALNPPVRGPAGSDVSSWSRHDKYGGRTVYTASTRGCAFDEVLTGFRRRLGTTDSLVKDTAAVGLSVAEFLAAIEEDWAALGVCCARVMSRRRDGPPG
jgi:hypothetical protein